MGAEIIAAEIRRLAALKGGTITADGVVAAATPKTSPLHSEFEWDNRIAGHAFRLQQARELIRSVKLVYERTEFVAPRAPQFVRNPSVDVAEQGYISIPVLRKDTDAARDAVVHEFAMAAAALTRARAVATALGLIDEIDELRERIVSLRDRIAEQPQA